MAGVNNYYPITDFSGRLDGQGYVIRNMTIDTLSQGVNNQIGFIGRLSGEGIIKNLGMTSFAVIGGNECNGLGGLVGYNYIGTISNCYAEGEINGGNYSNSLGGLVGRNQEGQISNCYAAGEITSGYESEYFGGLVGYQSSGTISECHSTVEITGGSSSDFLGGLVGYQGSGMISDCYATGTVNGRDALGGLVGFKWSGTITDSFATGAVNGGDYKSDSLGGLVDYIYSGFGIVSNCYATGAVRSGNSASYLDGLVGRTTANNTITNCYSTGAVTGGDNSYYLGGLVGRHHDTISNCYAMGAVSSGNGSYDLGGLVGRNHATISNCYSIGLVNNGIPADNIGGLLGYNDSGTIIGSFWDVDTSGQTTSDGGIGLSTEDMLKISTFTSVGWDFQGETANGIDDFWRMCEDNIRYPKLTWEFPAPDYVCPDSVDFLDFSVFAKAWQSTSADAQWNPACNLYTDDRIDLLDLLIFCGYWLNPIEYDLLAYLKLDETAGTTAYDSARFGQNGTLQGDTAWSVGHIDNAVTLDGDGDYIDLGSSSRLKPPLPITFSLWIKLDSLMDHQVIISLDTNDTGVDHRYYGSELLMFNTGEVAIAFGDGQPNYSMRYKIGVTQLTTDTWYHIAGVIRGSEDMDIYINGHNDNGALGGTGGPMIYLGGPAYLGSRKGLEFYVHGQLDDIRIYTRALSESEIQTLASN